MNYTKDNSRIILINTKEYKYFHDFPYIIDYLVAEDLGKVIWRNHECQEVQFLAHEGDVPTISGKLNEFRKKGLRHITYKLSTKRYDRIMEELLGEK